MSQGPTRWQVAGAVVRGLCFVALFALLLHGGIRYAAPAKVLPATASMRPIIEPGWIKVPFDIERTKECLSQATVTLTRTHDYGEDIGVREDKVILGLYNSTITDKGTHRVMLWFKRPDDVRGIWNFDAKAQDDCGGLLDLTNDQPRHVVVPHLDLGPES